MRHCPTWAPIGRVRFVGVFWDLDFIALPLGSCQRDWWPPPLEQELSWVAGVRSLLDRSGCLVSRRAGDPRLLLFGRGGKGRYMDLAPEEMASAPSGAPLVL